TVLRTGGMAGGAGEQAMATGMTAQVLGHWKMPCSVIAGATDSKLADFQAGYEKTLTVQSALQAGANLITQAAGAQAGLMGVDYGAMVADNDMLGAILRGNVSPEVSSETLALKAISEVVAGEGHFLGRPETYARMRSDFLYPNIADRSPLDVWSTSDHSDIEERSNTIANTILETHWPNHLPEALRLKLTRQFSLPQQKDLQE
ncbi:MAG: trimethylamine methyltransferase family protein, partial [Paracoccaceae bacterium]|nr:trimethylamine methyltransferase family protein [Paracoccaceae bacterium]